MERPLLKELRPEVENPQPAGGAETLGIIALNFADKINQWKKPLLSLAAAGVILAGGMYGISRLPIKELRGNPQVVNVTVSSAEFLLNNPELPAYYGGGIILNRTGDLTLSVDPSKIESIIRSLSYYNFPQPSYPVIHVFLPETETKITDRTELDANIRESTSYQLSSYANRNNISYGSSIPSGIAAYEPLIPYLPRDCQNINFGAVTSPLNTPEGKQGLSIELSLSLFRQRFRDISRQSGNNNPAYNLTAQDRELIKRELPIKVVTIQPGALTKTCQVD